MQVKRGSVNVKPITVTVVLLRCVDVKHASDATDEVDFVESKINRRTTRKQFAHVRYRKGSFIKLNKQTYVVGVVVGWNIEKKKPE